MDRQLLQAPLERARIGDDGRSGATLERLVLADGAPVVLKRTDPATDLVTRLAGDRSCREVELYGRGVLDDLPPAVGHAVLDGWHDDAGIGVLVMRDLGDSVLTWQSTVTAPQARTIFEATAALHSAFRGSAPQGLLGLDRLLGLFEPARIRPLAGAPLVDLALRGWQYWPEVAPGEVGDRVLELALDTTPLVSACATLEPTLLHGDLATVNLALEPNRAGCLTLIDWGLAAAGPAEVDVGRLLAGCAHLFAPSTPAGGAAVGERLDGLVALHRQAAGAEHDPSALLLGLLAGLTWLGWNKALDIVEHPDASVRERERGGLSWWLRQAERAFESGAV